VALQKREEVQQQRLSDVSFLLFFKEMLFACTCPSLPCVSKKRTRSMSTVGSDGNLAQGFKPRHVTMLSIAGIIGAGLFVGSGHAIAAAGPATILSYFVAGTWWCWSCACSAKWPWHTPTPGRSPPTPTRPSAAGPVTPSAGCTGGSGCW
jgi:amino acid permease